MPDHTLPPTEVLLSNTTTAPPASPITQRAAFSPVVQRCSVTGKQDVIPLTGSSGHDHRDFAFTATDPAYMITNDPIAPETAHALCMEIIEPYMTALVQTRSMAAEQLEPLEPSDIKQAQALGPQIIQSINKSVLDEPITTPPDKTTQHKVTPIASWANR